MTNREQARQRALAAMAAVADPAGGTLETSGRISGLVARDDGSVGLVLEVGDLANDAGDRLEAAVTQALRAAGATQVRVVQTAERKPQPAPSAKPGAIPGVRRLIAVGAGKGGVGKSTVAVNLALALRRRGLKVGILDADIQGPSVQILLGIHGQAHAVGEGDARRLVPLQAHGLKMLGMGVMTDPDKAVAWRGPMIAGAVLQMAQAGDWGELDVLVVDLPPGTGDIHLSLAQKLSPSLALVVTTPQMLARADARRAVAFFDLLKIPVAGVVMNMAGGIFGDAPEDYPAIATLPMDREVVAVSDAGLPLEDGPVAEALDGLAAQLSARLGL